MWHTSIVETYRYRRRCGKKNGNVVCIYLSRLLAHVCSCTSRPNSEGSGSWWWAPWALVLLQHASQPFLSAWIRFKLSINSIRYLEHWSVYVFLGPFSIYKYESCMFGYSIYILYSVEVKKPLTLLPHIRLKPRRKETATETFPYTGCPRRKGQ